MQLHLKELPISTKLQLQLGKHFAHAGQWSSHATWSRITVAVCKSCVWFMENGTGPRLLWSPAGKAGVYLQGNFMTSALTLNCSPVPRPPICCQAAVANASDWKPARDNFDQQLKSVIKSCWFTKRKCFCFCSNVEKRDKHSSHVYARCKVSILLC